MTKPTIKDVAEMAGCGIATVSRVLNGSGPSSLDTRERVLDAASKLGFTFNEVGRSLKSQRSKTIGVMVPTLSNPVFADAVEGVQQIAAANGYDVILTCANYDRDAEADAVTTLLAKQVEGVILTVSDPSNSSALDAMDGASVPYCLIFNQPKGKRRPAVGVDNTSAARVVGEKIIEFKHRNVAFVAVRFTQSERSLDRFHGLCEAYLEAGFGEPVLVEVDHEFGDLEVAFADLFDRFPDTTVLFASNDMLALACIDGLRAIGKRVPNDISVVGFDGISVANLVSPKLTTISTPCRDMGSKATQLLVNALAEAKAPPRRVISLPFEFRTGQSLSHARLKNADSEAATSPSAKSTTPPVTKHMK